MLSHRLLDGRGRRLAALLAVILAPLLVSYGATRAVASALRHPPAAPEDSATRAARIRRAFPSGPHLVAYVLVSHRCGFCAEKHTKEALGHLRSSLAASARGRFAKVTVIGVALDRDVEGELDYLHSLGHHAPPFDELSVGGSWLNEFVTQLVWRGGVIEARTPTVVLVQRDVDASRYPDLIRVAPDSVLMRVVGRDSLLAWVKAGTPIRSPDRQEAALQGGYVPGGGAR